jgi:hypothetical protein
MRLMIPFHIHKFDCYYSTKKYWNDCWCRMRMKTPFSFTLPAFKIPLCKIQKYSFCCTFLFMRRQKKRNNGFCCSRSSNFETNCELFKTCGTTTKSESRDRIFLYHFFRIHFVQASAMLFNKV